MKFLLKIILIFLLVGFVWVFIWEHIEGDNNSSKGKIVNNEKKSILSFYDDFTQWLRIGADTWTLKQLQRWSIKKWQDPLLESNEVLIMKAWEKQGSQVGKAWLVKAINHIWVWSWVIVEADFYFPEDTSRNSLILIDLECKKCWIDTNPGIRLYLRDEYLRVDRSKIGIDESFNQELDHKILSQTWYTLRMEVVFWETEGSTKVFIDDILVIHRLWINILTQDIVDEYNIVLENIWIDRVQVWMTANSNLSSQTLLLDNVSITEL